MATSSTLDFDALLHPIPGDDPAGGPFAFALRDQLEQSRKEIDPADFAQDDPTRPEQPVHADWPGIVHLTLDALTLSCKSLGLAARLTEALTHLHGFAGARDGLRFLRLLVEQAWDRLSPPLTDEDALDVRAGPLNWLGDADRGGRYPTTLRQQALLDGCSWLDWKQMQDGRGSVTKDDFEKALQATPTQACAERAADLDQALQDLTRLEVLLTQKMGQAAPALTGLRTALEDCATLAKQILQRKAPAISPAVASDKAVSAKPTVGLATSRSDVYRTLADAADRLQLLEPHSPIPYLVRRAVALGELPFPQLIKVLVREPNILQELTREFGIEEPAKN